MKRDWALLSGWGAGVFAAATVLLLALLIGGFRFPDPGVLPFIIIGVILAAGPGLLVLSVFLSVRLKRRRAGGAGRGSTLALGTLLGAALDVPALLVVPLIFMGPTVVESLSDPRRPEVLVLLAMGAVGGATGGFTCAWRVTRPAEGGA